MWVMTRTEVHAYRQKSLCDRGGGFLKRRTVLGVGRFGNRRYSRLGNLRYEGEAEFKSQRTRNSRIVVWSFLFRTRAGALIWDAVEVVLTGWQVLPSV